MVKRISRCHRRAEADLLAPLFGFQWQRHHPKLLTWCYSGSVLAWTLTSGHAHLEIKHQWSSYLMVYSGYNFPPFVWDCRWCWTSALGCIWLYIHSWWAYVPSISVWNYIVGFSVYFINGEPFIFFLFLCSRVTAFIICCFENRTST